MSTHEWSVMTGPVVKVPKLRSRRCQRCRWRKIKCDENWPTCTPCVKGRCPCSGPPAGLDGSDSESVSHLAPGSVMAPRAGSPAPSLMSSAEGDSCNHVMEPQDTSHLLSQYDYPGGGSYTRVRFTSSPRSYPTTTADRVASRLVGYLEPGSRFHASLAADYFRLLPPRIGSSAALRDAVAVFCTGWGNFRRATPPPGPLVDPRAYGKALRSLQRALSGDDNEGKQLACETLAAASVMDRVEALFTPPEGRGQSEAHARGVYSLMATRDPPNLDDELEVCLAFANQPTITTYLLSQGGDNFYLSQQWRDVMNQALNDESNESNPALVDFFYVSVEVGGWPGLRAQMQHIIQNITDPIEQTAEASMFWEKLDAHRATVEGILESFMADARRLGHLFDKPNRDCANGVEFVFTDIVPLGHFAMLLAFSIIVNRLQTVVSTVLWRAAPAGLEANHRRLCEFMWSCLPQMQRQGPASSLLFAMPLGLSLEAGDAAERRRTVDTLVRLGAAVRKLPSDVAKAEELLLAGAMLWTGKPVAGLLTSEEEVAE